MTTGPWAFRLTVGGRDLPTHATFPVVNPATERPLAQAPAVTPEQLDDAFDAAAAAFGAWRRDEDARRAVMRDAAGAIEHAVDDLAAVLTAEQGKPLAEAREEIAATVAWLRYYAELAVPREVLRDDDERFEEVVRRPLGVVAAIAPWNYPLVLAMWKIAPALRAGNTLVVKPSPYTPLSTLALGELLRGILPDGVLNVVCGPEPLGSSMVAHPVPRKVSFTGSTPVGKRVAVAAAADLKRVTLELGGNDPAVILDDVDAGSIAEPLFWGAFENNGQICLAVKRVYAHRRVHAELVEALAELAKGVPVGDGTLPDTRLGPINNRPQFDRITGLVDEARQRGGRAVAGGQRLEGDGYFYAPTILDSVSDGFRVVDEEQFGPVLPIIAFDDVAEATDRANRGQYGLTASVWSADEDRALAIAANIDAGQVSINAHGDGVLPHLPFGGHKWSGIGVENGRWGLESFTETQVVTLPRHHARDRRAATI
jgi:acyl-CoA reductase-like NAD-dependent aldehyde dehydrogenase